jgi:hypothetical protein
MKKLFILAFLSFAFFFLQTLKSKSELPLIVSEKFPTKKSRSWLVNVLPEENTTTTLR